MPEPGKYQPNKFFIKVEEGKPHGEGPKLFFMTHVPRHLSFADAKTLAHDILHHIGEAVGEVKFDG